jgi:UDP-glucuronate 4-epimerase
LKILITGVAGFIGMHTAKQLLEEGHEIVGIDNLNSYYEVELKKSRLNKLSKDNYDFIFQKLEITDTEKVSSLFEKFKFDLVIHLAAQAGVRYSIQNPYKYIDTNVKGFLNILESCKEFKIDKLIYASSSSVYGNGKQKSFSENDNTDHPISIYGATKKSNELMAFTYANLYKIKIIGLRFFTVYGPWGRPDMALFKFTNAILTDNEINIFNEGKLIRDFTYVSDVTESISRLIDKIDNGSIKNKHHIYNIGSENPISIMKYINTLEKVIGKPAKKIFLPEQLGDVLKTSSNSTNLYNLIDYKPKTNIEKGIANFVEWFKWYYKI